MINSFNFKHVVQRLNLHSSKEVHWVVGRALARWANENQIPVSRPLTPKTNPNARIQAPHCICAYPIEEFESALSYIQDRIKNDGDGDQMLLF